MTEGTSPFAGRRWQVDIATIAQGKSGEIQASNAECNTAASALELVTCKSLMLNYQLSPISRHRFRLRMSIVADVVQSSIVSLDDVPAHIDEAAESELVPEGTITPDANAGAADILNAPVIETYTEGQIDLGRIAFELLSVSLDPYPRKDGESLPEDHGPDKARISPFAALGALRKSEP